MFADAVRASPSSDSSGYCCRVLMVFRANPVRSVVGSGPNKLRLKSVFAVIPLASDFWIEGGEIVETSQGALA